MTKTIKTLLALTALLSTHSLFAQQDSTKNLGEVIVTGQYKPESVKNSVYQVRVINSQRIQLSGATNVQQVLNNQLGFRFSNDNTLGTTDVQLMGMSGRNVKILLDGVPMVDRGDTRESLGQIDINTIERIEIVEGPMSVSYGSDALAGVINIITKKNAKAGLSVFAKAQEETAGSEYYPFSYKGVHTQSVGATYTKKHLLVSVGGNHNDADGFGGDTYGRGKTWKPKEQWLGNVKLGYNSDKFNVYYRLDALHEDISSRNTINLANYKAVDQNYITKRFLHQAQSEIRFSKKIQLSTILAYTDYQRQTKTVRHNFATNTIEPNQAGESDVSKFTSFVFKNTVQYNISSKVSLQPGIDINREEASGARISGNPVIADYALFVSSEIKPTSKINIRPGLRFIKNSVYDAPPVIPSINTKFTLNKTMDVRLAYAYGFRSPALRELYFNFIDANHTILGNPNLKAEYSNSFNGSFSWNPELKHSAVAVSATVGGFYNVFNNLINYATDPNNSAQTITVNIDKFKTTGGTIEGKLTWKNLSGTLGFSYIGRYNDLSTDTTFKSENLPEFVWTPELNSNIIYTAKKIGTSIGLFYKYTGKRPGYQSVYNTSLGKYQATLTEIGSFSWADLTLTKTLYKYFTVQGGIKNIFDVTDLSNTSTTGGAHSTGGPVPMSYGRSYFLGINFQWHTKNK